MKKYKKTKRYYYFRKQRLYGVACLALAVLSLFITNELTVALLLGPLGLYLIFTKCMVITDDYFYEMEAKKFDKWKEP